MLPPTDNITCFLLVLPHSPAVSRVEARLTKQSTKLINVLPCVTYHHNVPRHAVSSIFSCYVQEFEQGGKSVYFIAKTIHAQSANMFVSGLGIIGNFFGESRRVGRSPFEVCYTAKGSEILLHLFVQGFPVKKCVDLV